MFKAIAAIAAAVLITGTFAFVWDPGAVEAAGTTRAGKGDRLDIRPVGPACSQHAWPYFETSCLRDRGRTAGRVPTARMVTTDRGDGPR
jgi:microcystin degradation protein MlrC